MNTEKLLKELNNTNINVQVDGCYLEVIYNKQKPLTENQLKYLRRYKHQIIQYLQAANQAQYEKRYSYRFSLKNNKGGGTYITDCPPVKAKQELIDMFIDREVESMDLLN